MNDLEEAQRVVREMVACHKVAVSQYHLYRAMARETLMTNLTPRIYALSKTSYAGSGYHYSLERELGSLISAYSDSESVSANRVSLMEEKWSRWVVDEVRFEGLCEDVIRAEQSIA